MTVAALVFFVAFAVEILLDLTPRTEGVAETVIWATWAIFAVDYVVRLTITENRRRWFLRHLLDLAIVVLPMLRPLRLMRFLTVVGLVERGAGNRLRGRVLTYTVGATALTVVIAALAVYDAERGAGEIRSFGDGVWWAFVTITTVGYGDLTPVTAVGRIVAVFLMIGGLALIGVIAATLSSWIVERVMIADEAPLVAATAAQVDALHGEIAELKEMVAALVPDSRDT